MPHRKCSPQGNANANPTKRHPNPLQRKGDQGAGTCPLPPLSHASPGVVRGPSPRARAAPFGPPESDRGSRGVLRRAVCAPERPPNARTGARGVSVGGKSRSQDQTGH